MSWLLSVQVFLKPLKKHLFFFCFLTSIFFRTYAQDSREELVNRYLNVGKYLIQAGNYDSAAIVLKSAFLKNAVLPDELLYYYSFVLFKKGELGQSEKLIDKFISISSPRAELFNDAQELKKSISQALDAHSISCEHCNGNGYHFHSCHDCNGTGEQECDICKGKGKVLIGSTNGMRFGVCITCKGDGARTCIKCSGEKEIAELCEVCGGKGKMLKTSDSKKL